MVDIIYFSVVSRSDVVLVLKSLLNFFKKDLLELIINFLMYVDMINGHTRLTTVEVLAENDPDGSTMKIGCFINYYWTLPA
jgi:hypothetical protein